MYVPVAKWRSVRFGIGNETMQISLSLSAEKGRGFLMSPTGTCPFGAARENGLNPQPTTDNRITADVSFSRQTDAVSDEQKAQNKKRKYIKRKKRKENEQNAKTKALGFFFFLLGVLSKLREMIYSQLHLPSVVLDFFCFFISFSFSQLDQPRSFF